MLKRILVFLLAMSALVPSLQAMNKPEPKSRMAQLATLASRHKGKIACGLLALAACYSIQGVDAGPLVFKGPADMCGAVSVNAYPTDYVLNETASEMWDSLYQDYIAKTTLDSVPRMVTELYHNKYANLIELFEYCYLNAKKVSLGVCYYQ